MERRVARLSEGQRECLRMVYRHMETKEIARAVGLSPDGVDRRIKTAMRSLGVHRRRDAAYIVAEAEGLAPGAATLAASTEGEPMREEQAAYWPPPFARMPMLPLPIAGARPDDAGLWMRLAWIAGLMIGMALAFGALVAGVEALTRLVWS